MFFNAVYYPNWHVYSERPPSNLNFSVISHAFYAFAWVKPDGSIYLSDEWADDQMEVDGEKGALRAFGALKRRHNILKVVLSIGGGGKGSEPFAAVAADPTARETFARSARALVDQYGLDGIDIDWEHPSDHQQGINYLHLLAALRRYLPAPQFMLTSALPAGQWALQHIDLAQAAQYLDLINVMTYDYSGPWVDRTGHHAQLCSPSRPHNDAAKISGQSAVQYLRSRGVPVSKILFGVPTYGRSFLGAKKVGDRYKGCGGNEGTHDYRDLPLQGSQESTDNQTGSAYCVGKEGFVSYDNPQTVAMKGQFVKQNGLAGLFYWTGTADSRDDKRSLVLGGYLAMHS
ncbi:glycoside hydrolase [Eremomyces bilateralis CBS 781.70]|uniref:chitinase n=1 Tax=Eremomyces bilateralis CBS 781.70 TaxID=1392243 RepID=A0A6G1G2W0_9PEZI|nr:glycoside hydrolase [Eremomyces bilateralis CBS 781.70]KAF1812394.1 glycoside hydrolase [Eremomyces bilateralis CBS 781.70]